MQHPTPLKDAPAAISPETQAVINGWNFISSPIRHPHVDLFPPPETQAIVAVSPVKTLQPAPMRIIDCLPSTPPDYSRFNDIWISRKPNTSELWEYSALNKATGHDKSSGLDESPTFYKSSGRDDHVYADSFRRCDGCGSRYMPFFRHQSCYFSVDHTCSEEKYKRLEAAAAKKD